MKLLPEKARLARCLALAVRRAGTDVTCEANVPIPSPTGWRHEGWRGARGSGSRREGSAGAVRASV